MKKERRNKLIIFVLAFVCVALIFIRKMYIVKHETHDHAARNCAPGVTIKASLDSNETLKFRIKNDQNTALKLYWIDFERRPQVYETIEIGHFNSWPSVNSYRNHVWVLYGKETHECLVIKLDETSQFKEFVDVVKVSELKEKNNCDPCELMDMFSLNIMDMLLLNKKN